MSTIRSKASALASSATGSGAGREFLPEERLGTALGERLIFLPRLAGLPALQGELIRPRSLRALRLPLLGLDVELRTSLLPAVRAGLILELPDLLA